MEVFCRTQSSRAAFCSVVELFVAEATSVAEKTLLSLLLAIGSLSSQTGQLVEGPDAIYRVLQKSKHESVPENKDDGESDEDDEEDDDDDRDGEDQEEEGGEGDPSGDENDNEGDENEDPEANGEGGSEEDDDDDDDDDDDEEQEEEEDEEDEEEDEELPQPPTKKRK